MNKITLFYLLLATILVTKTISTMYDRSLVIHHGSTVQELQQQKLSLKQQETALQMELSQRNSLALVQQSDELSLYQPISRPLIITNHSLTASQF